MNRIVGTLESHSAILRDFAGDIMFTYSRTKLSIAVYLLCFLLGAGRHTRADDPVPIGLPMPEVRPFGPELEIEGRPFLTRQGDRLAVILPGPRLALLDAATGKLLRIAGRTFRDNFPRNAVTFSPNGDRLLIARSDGMVHEYDVATETTRILPPRDIRTLSSGGEFAVVKGKDKIEIQRTQTAEEVAAIPTRWNYCTSLALSADSQRMAILSGYVSVSDTPVARDEQTRLWVWTQADGKLKLMCDEDGYCNGGPKAVDRTKQPWTHDYFEFTTDGDVRTFATSGEIGGEEFLIVFGERNGQPFHWERRFPSGDLFPQLSRSGRLLLLQSFAGSFEHALRNADPNGKISNKGFAITLYDTYLGKPIVRLDAHPTNRTYVFSRDERSLFRHGAKGLEQVDLGPTLDAYGLKPH